jgi:hypothetical protein
MNRVVKWDYERGTWQYDVFCLLIIAFIFLTPKTWFNNRRTLATQERAVVVQSDDRGSEMPARP